MLRKIVSIHSEDRDIVQWKNSNEFEITLPESISNIRSIQICHALFPDEIVFSRQYMNTMIEYNIGGDISYIVINDGNYTGQELANELRNAFYRKGKTDMRVIYERSKNKFTFLNEISNFSLNFNIPTSKFLTQISESDISNNMELCDYHNKSLNIFENKINWGLGYYLGFMHKRGIYNSTVEISANEVVTSLNINDDIWTSMDVNPNETYNILQSEYPAKLEGDKMMYLEIEPFNFLDEIDPNNANTNNTYNNQSSSRVNSAFSKILLQVNDNNSSPDTFLSTEHSFDPPLPRLTKVKFRFRYHDGRLIDFQNQDFSLSLKIEYHSISRR